MIKFILNGKEICTDVNPEMKLIEFLRVNMELSSVKDGCAYGACGTCTVIVDNKAIKSCILPIKKIEGKEVITSEGLTKREQDVFAHCFGEAGAVQCGYCIPGMVLSAKALIDNNNNPNINDVKNAIKGNICRCTGYVKIEEAILEASKYFRENKEVVETEASGKINEPIKRLDAREKTLGTGIYSDDLHVEGMIYGRALRTPVARAKIIKIDIEEAKKHKGCEAIVLAKDIPGQKKIGHLVKDWDVLIAEGETTHYIGDALALVAAKSYTELVDVLALIKVEYEELPPINSPEMAMDEKNGVVHFGGNNLLKHEILHKGNPDEIIEKSAFKVTNHYSVPFTEHAFLEPECCVCMPHPDIEGGVFLQSGGQGIYDEQHEIADMLGIPYEKVHVQSKLVGGGFGGKEDMSVQHHAALLAYITKKPVKVKLTRRESINIHPKRHAMEIDLTTACDENGKLTAMKANIISDTGAYASLGGPVLQRACTHAAGPYNYQDIHIEGKAYYTNNPPGGAFRGFGVCQSAFATEGNLNMLAELVGISAFDIRKLNAIRVGEILPNGQIADESTALVECLDALKDVYDNNKYVGIASCFKNAGIGVGIPDVGRCIVSVEQGKIHVRTSAACIGQGIATVSLQIACETLGMSPNNIVVEQPDTTRTPNSGTTTASRQTVFTGEAVHRACSLLKVDLDNGATISDLEGKEYQGEYGSVTDPLGSDKPNPVSHVAYGYAAQAVVLDDNGKVTKVVAAYDVGQVINKKACEGQIEGGVVMGLGYGLTEDFPLKDGVPQAKFGTLGLFKATDVPVIETIIVDNGYRGDISYGSKGVGELATIPTAPACQGAYYKFDGEFRTKLPMENTAYSKVKK